MEKSNAFFATERPARLFFTLALPGMVSMLAMSVYQAFEGAFVGQTLGGTAFAAVNIGMPIVLINFSLADMVGVGSAVPISVALGRRDEKTACNIFSASFALILLMAALMGVVIFLAAPGIVALMGAEGALAALSVRYVRVFAALGPVTTLFFALDNYLRISGFVRGSMGLNLLMAALTAGFLVLFLLVAGMDVEGSALATCCAMLICVGLALIPFLRGKAVLKFTQPRITGALLRQIVTCGAPTFLNNMAGRIASILMNSALLRLGGETAVAAYSVMMYAAAILEPMLYGLSDSVQPAIGYNWGAGSLGRVRELACWSLGACGVLSVISTGVMCCFPEVLAGIFVDARELALMRMVLEALPLFGLSYLFGWVSFALQGFFAAVEKPLPATILSLCRAMVFPVALIFALEPLGLTGLWLNPAATAVLAMMLAAGLLMWVQRAMGRDIRRRGAA